MEVLRLSAQIFLDVSAGFQQVLYLLEPLRVLDARPGAVEQPVVDTNKQPDTNKGTGTDKQTNVNTPVDKSKVAVPPTTDTTKEKGTTTEQPITDKKAKPKNSPM